MDFTKLIIIGIVFLALIFIVAIRLTMIRISGDNSTISYVMTIVLAIGGCASCIFFLMGFLPEVFK
mgnify:CR=1 FL=1